LPLGQVIRSHSNQFYVLVEGREVLCRPRGKFRIDHQNVLAGDQVEVQIEGTEGRIERVLPRTTVLQHPAVANVDQVLVVFTLRDPMADYGFLDRVLIHAERVGIKTAILLNKVDLLSEAEVEQFCHTYGVQVGYPVVPLAAKLGDGLADLIPLLVGRISVLAGHSGVGKSRLVKALEPTLENIRIGELSEKLGRGKHTTRHVELIPLTVGGLLVDSPGFTYLEFTGLQKWDLAKFLPEFGRLTDTCRFADCVHHKEPDCAVRAAVDNGQIARSRYENYLLFLGEVEAIKRW